MAETNSVMQALANELARTPPTDENEPQPKDTSMPTADELIQPAAATPPLTDEDLAPTPSVTPTQPPMTDTGTNWEHAIAMQTCRIAAADMTAAELLAELDDRWQEMKRNRQADGNPPADHLLRIAETARRAAQAVDDCQRETVVGNKLLLASRPTDIPRHP